jgi:arachidonate 15-lipoxygenase
MKYLPAPIGVFLELPGFNEGIDLVPLAILIDQPAGARNRVFYPDEVPKKRKNWGWEIAKLYFETADEIFHAGCGHVLRTHLAMNPFCMATPRQLPDNHPVSMLLRPHTRFTLATNEAVYEYYVNPKKAYADFYSGKLEEHRRFSISSYEAKSFLDLSLPAELESRQVCESPEVYPYRDDALLWLKPIRDFVTEYIDAFYADDAAINHDVPLQAWKDELVHPDCGGVRGLVPDDALDTRKKLVDLLAQVLFIAGPGHASQHFAEMYFYRYPPAFVGSAYAPPPWKECDANKARWYQTLPPIGQATKQFIYSTFGNFQYDTFGHYRRYPLGRLPEAQEPIRKLQAALCEVESTIHARGATRPLRYDFLLPSRVPNSINI